MILHIFGLRWKPGVAEEQKQRALDQIRSFPASIPGIHDLHAGSNLSPQSQGYATVGTMRFADQAALQHYLQHPMHQQFVQWVGPLVEAVDLDLEVSANL